MRTALRIVCVVCLAAAAPYAIGADATWTDTSGASRTLEDYRGEVVVLNFWATWCAPCVKELPLLSDAQRRYAIDGVRVLGVSADDPARPDDVIAFARKRKVGFAVLLGGTTEQMTALDLGEALPATAVLDRDGKVVARFRGTVTRSTLEQAIEQALAGESGTARDHGDPAHDDEHAHDHGAGHDDAPDAHDLAEQAGADSGGTEASLVPS